jgi:hypothetical protein
MQPLPTWRLAARICIPHHLSPQGQPGLPPHFPHHHTLILSIFLTFDCANAPSLPCTLTPIVQPIPNPHSTTYLKRSPSFPSHISMRRALAAKLSLPPPVFHPGTAAIPTRLITHSYHRILIPFLHIPHAVSITPR